MLLLNSRRLSRTLSLLAAAQLVNLAQPDSALACGGLFCSATTPVNQAAERIIFAQDESTITQIVEIQYEGPAERFAWVLPVPGVPEFDVSSSIVLDRLQQATNPQYILNNVLPDTCEGFSGIGGTSAADGGNFAPENEGPSVTVLDAGSVGPFDYEVISVDAADEDPAAVAIEWLEQNGYDVSALGPDVLRPYLANGLNLLAFRLQKGVDTGAIQPVSLTYQASVPAIPIRPTAVAANDDMGVMVWLLGPARGVPTNYMGLELNELYIDWINPNNNYNRVVTLAADEAGGQGFVTEFAGEAARFHDVVDPGFDRIDLDALSQYPLETALEQLANQYANYDGFSRVFAEHVTLREPLTTEDFLTCAWCYFNPENNWTQIDYGTYDEATDPIHDTNLAALVAAVDDQVVRPIRVAADLFLDHPYLTRFYTTLSAGEMDLDPTFDFNPDLEDVSNVHTAERQLTCEGISGPWRVTLSDGRKVYGEGNVWPITLDDGNGLPFNSQILSFGTSGPPEVLVDNNQLISASFRRLPASKPNEIDRRSGGNFWGCSVGGLLPSSSAIWLVLSVGGLGALAGRRRRAGRAGA